MLLEESSNEGVDERAVGDANAREVDDQLFTNREVGVDLRDTKAQCILTIPEACAKGVAEDDFVVHGRKLAE